MNNDEQIFLYRKDVFKWINRCFKTRSFDEPFYYEKNSFSSDVIQLRLGYTSTLNNLVGGKKYCLCYDFPNEDYRPIITSSNSCKGIINWLLYNGFQSITKSYINYKMIFDIENKHIIKSCDLEDINTSYFQSGSFFWHGNIYCFSKSWNSKSWGAPGKDKKYEFKNIISYHFFFDRLISDTYLDTFLPDIVINCDTEYSASSINESLTYTLELDHKLTYEFKKNYNPQVHYNFLRDITGVHKMDGECYIEKYLSR